MNHRLNRSILLRVLACLCVLALTQRQPPLVRAAQLVVDIAVDENDGGCVPGDCSLREAIAAAAASGDTITFAGDYVITLAMGQLTIAKNVTIDGTGHSVTVSGNNASRVFEVASGYTVVLRSLGIMDGDAGVDGGGGLWNNGGTVTLEVCLVAGNYARRGGGIRNQSGTMTIRDTTISGNDAEYGGGGVYNDATLIIESSTLVDNQVQELANGWGTGGGLQNVAGATSAIVNSTFANNQANGANDDGGGGIMVYGGTVDLTNCTLSGNSTTSTGGGGGGIRNLGAVNLKNTLIANNTSAGSGPDIYGAVNSLDYNLIEDTAGATIGGTTTHNITGLDPLLFALGSYGGDTQTMPLLPGSPAIDAADAAACAAAPVGNVDQRGLSRTTGASCDIGAFESRGFGVTITGGNNQTAVINTLFASPLRVQATSAYGEPVGPSGQLVFAGPGAGASTVPIAQTAPTTDSTGKAEVSVTANGTTGSYSVTVSAAGVITPALFSLTNRPPNQPPTAGGGTVSTNEDVDYAFSQGNLGYNDPNGDPFDHLRIITLPADGTLYRDGDGDGRVDAGEALAANDIVSAADIAAGRFKFEPAADENGSPYTSFTFRVHDGMDESISDSTITINVVSVNDRPSFTDGGLVAVPEDSAPQTVPGWAKDRLPGPADELGQVITFTVTNDNNALFAVQPMVNDVNGDLTFTPAANAYGMAWVTVYLHDNGGTANGGLDISVPHVFTITVSPVNDPPTISSIANQQIDEGTVLGPLVLTVGDMDTPLTSLTLSGASSDPALVPLSSIIFGGTGANRTLTVTPTPGLTGVVTITVTVNDGSTSASDSFVLTVREVTVRTVYLPLVMKNVAGAPDLVVLGVAANANDVFVMIANVGSAPVVDEFWVDVYVAPDTIPTAVNQTWQLMGSHGAAWGITSAALPIQPGQVLILNLSSPYLVDAKTDLGTVVTGTQLYAQVDSAAVGSVYGAVLETHEMTGGAYNNVTSSMTPTGFSGLVLNRTSVRPALSIGLPERP